MLRRTLTLLVGSLAVGVSLASVAPATTRTTGELQVNAVFEMRWAFGDHCPPGTATHLACVRFLGTGGIPGLGLATVTYVKTVDFAKPDCPVVQFRTAVLAVRGKGEIQLSVPREICGQTAPARTAPFEVTIAGGSGAYANASGRLRFSSNVFQSEKARDTWTGTLTAPDVEFDVSSPRFGGASSRTVRAPAGSKRIRVRFSVTANDAADGSVPVACRPRSGSLFGLGRTAIACSATDSSQNTARTRFTITVR